MAIDPYSSPSVNFAPPSRASDAAITQGVIQQLAGTKPWVRFISVMVFVGTGLMVLVGVSMILMGSVITHAASPNPLLASGLGVGFGVFYLVLALLCIYPGIKLWKYASRIGDLVHSGSAVDLELALNEQRSYWKFLGIMMIGLFCLYLLVFVGIAVMAFFGAMPTK